MENWSDPYWDRRDRQARKAQRLRIAFVIALVLALVIGVWGAFNG